MSSDSKTRLGKKVCVCLACRDLLPRVAVWWKSGDPPLQQSGPRVQEEAPVRVPGRERQHVHQVRVLESHREGRQVLGWECSRCGGGTHTGVTLYHVADPSQSEL